MEVAGRADLLRHMEQVVKEWPTFELLDVYDDADTLVLRLAAGEADILN